MKNDLDFTWNLQASFEMRIHELKAYKTANGHCDVPTTGKDVPLGRWCSLLRVSYKKIQKNQTPRTKLSDEEIQCLNDLDFTWNLQASLKTNKYQKK